MDDLSSIETQLRERLAAGEARRHESQESLSREMTERDRRSNRFKAVAKHLLNKVIFPRLQMLEGLFPNAHVTTGGSPNTRLCKCSFDHTPDFPASTTLKFSLSADDDIKCVVVGYKLEILPIFFRFEPTDQFVVPLDDLHEQPLASWLDAKLLQFADTYLKLHDIPQYQQENMAVDPVCGMRINRNHAIASVEHDGKTYYFCAVDCWQKFLKDPNRYTGGGRERNRVS
jgi:YHS domain-containing protein